MAQAPRPTPPSGGKLHYKTFRQITLYYKKPLVKSFEMLKGNRKRFSIKYLKNFSPTFTNICCEVIG